MTKRLLLYCFFVLLPVLSFAQKEANHWYFGLYAGLDFSGGAPVNDLNGQVSTPEGCASISDPNGNLLFYTDGQNVFTKNHTTMQNGTGLWGHWSSTQSSLIVPATCNEYYIFTADAGTKGFEYDSVFAYSVVDMSLNGGLGAVTQKNVKLLSPVHENIAAVYHANNTNVWVLTNKYGTNEFYAYLVTGAGVSAPIVSSLGPIHGHTTMQLKFSPDGSKVAAGFMGVNPAFEAVIYDFDNVNGTLSNPRGLGTNSTNIYLTFSPNSQFLYMRGNGGTTLEQYDVTAGGGTAAAIIASRVTVFTATVPPNDFRPNALQNAPDGKIYITRGTGQNGTGFTVGNAFNADLGVINNPNVKGVGCNYTNASFNLGGRYAQNSLPNFIESYFDPNYVSPPAGQVTVDAGNDTSICTGATVQLDATIPNGVTYVWSPTTGLSNPNIANPVATPTGDIEYIVTVTDVNGCVGTDTVNVSLLTNLIAEAGPDQTICVGDSIQLNASGGSIYAWNASTDLSDINVADPWASPSTTTTFTVTVSDGACPPGVDSVTVTVVPSITADAGTGVTVCNGDTVQLNASGGSDYEWIPNTYLDNNLIANPVSIPSNTITYSVVVSSGNCAPDTAEVTITVVPSITPVVPGDTVICLNESVALTASGGSSYQWSPSAGLDSTTTATVNASPTVTTTYVVEVTSGSCAPAKDSVTIYVMPPLTVSAGNNTTICEGETVWLGATITGSASGLQWSTGSTSDSIMVMPTTTTDYYITATAVLCQDVSDTVTVTVGGAAATADLSQTIQLGQSVTLIATGGVTYSWTPTESLDDASSASPTATPDETTTYTVVVTDANNCPDTAYVTITVNDLCGGVDDAVYIPTAFSPNGDGVNDVFTVRAEEGCVDIIRFHVYNRWGELVYEWSKSNPSWNGIYRNNYQNSAVFDYYFEGKLFNDEDIIRKGNISLIR